MAAGQVIVIVRGGLGRSGEETPRNYDPDQTSVHITYVVVVMLILMLVRMVMVRMTRVLLM